MKIPKSYRFRREPWAHQRTALERSWNVPAFALLMEQGTGKTKVAIDTAGLLYATGRVDGLLVVAPNGVQRAWIRDALPAHMSPAIPYVSALWRNQRTKAQEADVERLWDSRFVGLRVLAINYETLLTDAGYRAARMFTDRFRTLLAADESHKIKTPDAKRTEAMLRLSTRVPYRRILTGTPIDGAPFGYYSQFCFLDEEILGFRSFVAFKAHHAQLLDKDDRLMHAINRRLEQKHGKEKARRMQPRIVAKDEQGRPIYRNLEELRAKVAPYSYRVLKSECLDLPPKVYQRRYVEMNPEQRRVYADLRDTLCAEYDGVELSAVLKLTLLLRLQQVAGGFFAAEPGAAALPLGDTNPKVQEVLDVCAEATGKVIVWCRFTGELSAVVAALAHEYGPDAVVRYDGTLSDSKRDAGKWQFQTDAGCRFFVGQVQAGGTGLDGLQVADTVVFYSNGHSLLDRLQAEDRAHRGGSEVHDRVTVVDIEAEGTVDRRIVETLRAGKHVADAITGDAITAWIT